MTIGIEDHDEMRIRRSTYGCSGVSENGSWVAGFSLRQAFIAWSILMYRLEDGGDENIYVYSVYTWFTCENC